MGDDPQEWNAEKVGGNRPGDLQGIEVFLLLSCENGLYGSAQASQGVAAQDGSARPAGPVEEAPTSAFDASRQRPAIGLLHNSPAWQEGLAFDQKLRRKICAFLDEDRGGSVCVCHLEIPCLLTSVIAREPGLDDPALAVSLARR